MTTFLSALITGAGQGAVYALIAVSFVIIFRATGVLNFAQPALMILGAFATSVFATQLGVPFAGAVILAMVVLAAFSILVERVAIRPMVGRPPWWGLVDAAVWARKRARSVRRTSGACCSRE